MAHDVAAGLGANRVAPEHILLALLWKPDGIHTALLNDLGVSRRAVQRMLSKLGATVPRGYPPAPDDTRWGETFTIRIPSSDAWELANRTLRLIPEGAPMAFNFDHSKAWYTSGEGVDLAPLVRKARRQQLADQRRRRQAEQA